MEQHDERAPEIKGQSTKTKTRVSTRALRKRQRIIRRRIMTIVIIVVLLVAAGVGFLVYSLAPGGSEVSTLTLKDNGRVIYEEIEAFDDPSYDTGEIKGYVKEQIKAYNQKETTTGEVKLLKCKVKKDNTVYLSVQYDSFDTYLDFTGFEGFMGTIKDAIAAGYSLESGYIAIEEPKETDEADESTSESSGDSKETDANKSDATDSSMNANGDDLKTVAVDVEEVLKDQDKNVLVLRENTIVCVGQKVLYLSDDGSRFINKNTVNADSKTNNPDISNLHYIIYE